MFRPTVSSLRACISCPQATWYRACVCIHILHTYMHTTNVHVHTNLQRRHACNHIHTKASASMHSRGMESNHDIRSTRAIHNVNVYSAGIAWHVYMRAGMVT